MNTKENALISSLIYISAVIGKAKCLRKKCKTVTPSRRLQAEDEMSTLQRGKNTNMMRKIYQSSRSLKIKIISGNKIYFFLDFSSKKQLPDIFDQHFRYACDVHSYNTKYASKANCYKEHLIMAIKCWQTNCIDHGC